MTIVAVPAAGTGNPSQPQNIPMVEVYDYLTLPGVPSSAQNAPGMAGKKVKVTLAYDKAQSAAPDSVTWLANEPVYATVTDPNGFWHLFLVPNNKINPTGTYYVVQIEGYMTYKIRVTDVGAPAIGWQSSAIAFDLPTALGVSGFTLPDGTTVNGALTVQGVLTASGRVVATGGVQIITGDGGNILAGNVQLLGAAAYNVFARADAQLELRNTNPLLSFFQVTNPGSTVNEGAITYSAYDASGTVFKSASMSSKWYSATAANPAGVVRVNAAGAVAGVSTDDVVLRLWFRAGASFFDGANDLTPPGLGILSMVGVGAGQTVRMRQTDSTKVKLFEFVGDFVNNLQIWQTNTNEIARATLAGAVTWAQAQVITAGGLTILAGGLIASGGMTLATGTLVITVGNLALSAGNLQLASGAEIDFGGSLTLFRDANNTVMRTGANAWVVQDPTNTKTLLTVPVTGPATVLQGLIVGADLRRSRQQPTEAVLVSGVDATLGEDVLVTLTANRVVGLPLNPAIGQELTYTLIQGGAGGFTAGWNAGFKQSWSDAGNTVGKRSTIVYWYDGANWNQKGGQTPYV